ncbi:MAG: hypothetical protein E7619_03250 [Ruminococcaceae bacterium]|nr:hypothetical protein [Oscillospiraceae bacterium]
MIENDTVRLLRECDAGAKMGIESIDDVLSEVSSEGLKNKLIESKDYHSVLTSEIHSALQRCGDEGKDPAMIAKGMSKIKTNAMLAIKHTDATIADLMTDGCNMGVKSLSRYLNQYPAADSESRSIAKRLIEEEESLAREMRTYL